MKEIKDSHDKYYNYTFFLDLDGTCWQYADSYENMLENKMVLCPGVKEKVDEWYNRGDKIIITTARNEEDRAITIRQLEEVGLKYHLLIMGDFVTSGPRVVINDEKPDLCNTAAGYSLIRNEGFEEIDLPLFRRQGYNG